AGALGGVGIHSMVAPAQPEGPESAEEKPATNAADQDGGAPDRTEIVDRCTSPGLGGVEQHLYHHALAVTEDQPALRIGDALAVRRAETDLRMRAAGIQGDHFAGGPLRHFQEM